MSVRLGRDELVERYVHRRQSQERIAAEVGVHRVTVSAWLREEDIPTRRGGWLLRTHSPSLHGGRPVQHYADATVSQAHAVARAITEHAGELRAADELITVEIVYQPATQDTGEPAYLPAEPKGTA